MAVDANSGQITWNPTTDDLGTHGVTLRVEDGRGGYATQTYVVSVITPPPNRPPVFTSVPVVDANVNTAYAYQATATDPDGDPLTFAVQAGPDGLTIERTDRRGDLDADSRSSSGRTPSTWRSSTARAGPPLSRTRSSSSRSRETIRR